MFTKHKEFLNALTEQFIRGLPEVVQVKGDHGEYLYHDVYLQLARAKSSWQIEVQYDYDDDEFGWVVLTFQDQGLRIIRRHCAEAALTRTKIELAIWDILAEYFFALSKLEQIAQKEREPAQLDLPLEFK